MILGFHHTAIASPDVERLAAFYETQFGMERILDKAWSDAPQIDAVMDLPGSAGRMIVLRHGAHCLELFAFESPAPAERILGRRVCDPGITHIGIVVEDIDREYARLQRAGMRFNAAPTQGGALRLTYGSDPDGNVIELMEFVGDHPMKPDAQSGSGDHS